MQKEKKNCKMSLVGLNRGIRTLQQSKRQTTIHDTGYWQRTAKCKGAWYACLLQPILIKLHKVSCNAKQNQFVNGNNFIKECNIFHFWYKKMISERKLLAKTERDCINAKQ